MIGCMKKTRMTKAFQARQGDVFIDTNPPAAVLGGRRFEPGDPIARESGAVVVAHGEATGHRHQIVDDGALLFELRIDDAGAEVDRMAREAFRVLRVSSGGAVSLRHEEHGVIPLAPGDCSVERQGEWTDEDERVVAD
jgi:hypothetical protein